MVVGIKFSWNLAKMYYQCPISHLRMKSTSHAEQNKLVVCGRKVAANLQIRNLCMWWCECESLEDIFSVYKLVISYQKWKFNQMLINANGRPQENNIHTLPI